MEPGTMASVSCLPTTTAPAFLAFGAATMQHESAGCALTRTVPPLYHRTSLRTNLETSLTLNGLAGVHRTHGEVSSQVGSRNARGEVQFISNTGETRLTGDKTVHKRWVITGTGGPKLQIDTGRRAKRFTEHANPEKRRLGAQAVCGVRPWQC